MEVKSRTKSIIITLFVFTVMIGLLALYSMKCFRGVSEERIEEKAREFHNIDDEWPVIKATNDDVSAMLFYPTDGSSHIYSIYNKHNGLSNGYFFRIGGTISEINSGCVQFIFDENHSRIYISMNSQRICKVEIDDGNHMDTVLLDEEEPFVLVYPSNVGNVTFYNAEGELVAPVQRDVP